MERTIFLCVVKIQRGINRQINLKKMNKLEQQQTKKRSKYCRKVTAKSSVLHEW